MDHPLTYLASFLEALKAYGLTGASSALPWHVRVALDRYPDGRAFALAWARHIERAAQWNAGRSKSSLTER